MGGATSVLDHVKTSDMQMISTVRLESLAWISQRDRQMISSYAEQRNQQALSLLEVCELFNQSYDIYVSYELENEIISNHVKDLMIFF